ncbi:ATP-binding protein [Polaribacter sp. Hel_I_88]|uniref:ATP-binding protein n=1 Tax=Polaribacter sp. Hel_I_88 TaxID=1250006 RepID=UPI00047D90E1|nr:ATP-binding protein [Polaribacter sp. Hel_I_88]
MINKRLLIKNLLSHNDENSFYDKKQQINLSIKEGKAKFLKHICALSNANPENNSYIVIGIEDKENKIVGVDFFDDSNIQNLINAYLHNPPKIEYENVRFPRLQRHKVIGLVTIYPNHKTTSLLKNIWKYKRGTIFYRRGSNSIPFLKDNFELRNTNKEIVAALEINAKNNIELTLNGVFDFVNNHKTENNPKYKVFNEQFVLCWAGEKKIINGLIFFSRVDIELINEQVQLFFSSLDDVQIRYNKNSFIITEYILLGIDTNETHYPLEKTIINFKNNGKYNIVKEFLFEAPIYDEKILKTIFDNSNKIIAKIESKSSLSIKEQENVCRLPTNYLVCFLNGYLDAPNQLKKAKIYFKSLEDKTTYIKYKETLRVFRKIKYS